MNALELSGIVRRFGDVVAVDGVSLEAAAGEVLAVVGENGAGKSTLVSVASGLYAQDAGTVRAFGRELERGDARAAIEAGVGAVHQHFMLIRLLTVWENVVLGREPRRLGFIDRRRARAEVAEAAHRYGLALDLDARIDQLGVASQQRVEIVRQLWRGARVLLLDEPTAVLSPLEITGLLRTIRSLASEGRSVIFISHKLREVLEVADRIAVLRRGHLVDVKPRSRTDATQLTSAMISGTAHATPHANVAGEAPPRRSGTELRGVSSKLVSLRRVSCLSDRGRPALRDLSFELGGGEILGVAGVDGNGQAELAEVLTGMRQCKGTLSLEGDEGFHRNPAAARAAGVAHLPEDRQRRALCPPLSCEENLALGHQRAAPWASGALIDRAGRRAKARELMAVFDVRPADPLVLAGALSGGNQQKLVVARELSAGAAPRLIVAVHPTRGLDPGARRRVHGALRSSTGTGAGVVMISLDLDELRAVCDRILVLFEGRSTGEAGPDATDDVLGRMMLGQGSAHA